MNTNQGLISADAVPVPKVYSAELLGKSRELRIMHRGEEYRLQVTSTNKLLLTK